MFETDVPQVQSDGITDGIIDKLSHLPDLKVMSHNAVFHYKGKQVDLRVVGRELGVEAVLTGRVVKRNDALSISLELVDARDNSRIWGNQYDSKLSDLLELQRQIPLDISERLRLTLTGEGKERLTKRYTDNPEAYQLYLQGRYFLGKSTQDGARKAIDYFRKAIEKDPNYALAYSGIADAHTFGVGTGIPLKEARAKAREAAMKAVTLDPLLGEAHAALAGILLNDDWDFTGAEREYKRSIDLRPSNVDSHHQYSHYLLAVGRIEESLVESKKVFELDPISLLPNEHYAYHYLYARKYDEAIRYFLISASTDPGGPATHQELGDAYYQKEMFSEAVEEYLKARILNRATPAEIAASREAFAKDGIKGFLRKTIAQLKASGQPEPNAWPMTSTELQLAATYARLGEKDQAFEWLEKGYRERSDGMVHIREELAFDNIRSDPRFADLLRRIGLPPP